MKLSKRLETIALQVPPGSRLADIGSDHALLPVYLVQKGRVPYAVAGELNPGPYDAARKQVKEASLGERIVVRQADGLRAVLEGEVDAVSIAGMGGALIVHILEEGRSKLDGVHTLVLQPNIGEDQVRRWLVQNGWQLAAEQLLEEDGKFYEVLTAVRNDDQAGGADLYAARELGCGIEISEALLYRLGPYLVEQPNEAFFAKWRSELAKLEGIAADMTRSDAESARLRREMLLQDIAATKEVLVCLQKERQ
ncbi:tRNA (adenine(22)-N(1))-methyltransferase [Paenibacillus koleovorans]|uniref:tRNA (adenine(22)-N(1))-methyltransferase n=1 Tax=Paenibacillus koleovorans TaxID=121608 RepID=UPI0015811BA5|nr:class I SAM-dependent methyltransferase [Paenibacillus koleovorans]